MKILLLTLPRTGSKFILKNLASYINSNFSDAITLEDRVSNIPRQSLDELLNPMHNQLNQGILTRKSDTLILNPNPAFNPSIEKLDLMSAEFFNRVKLVQNGSWAGKFFMESYDLRYLKPLYTQILPMVDRIILVSRDHFEVTLSLTISCCFDSFNNNDYQNQLIKKLVAAPEKIDLEFFSRVQRRTSYFYSIFVPFILEEFNTKTTFIDFDDLTKIQTEEQFSNTFNLSSTYQFIREPIEFHDNKYRMISNLTELSSVFKANANKLQQNLLITQNEFYNAMLKV